MSARHRSTPTAAHARRLLQRFGEITSKQVAAAASVRLNTARRALDKLVELGEAKRERRPAVHDSGRTTGVVWTLASHTEESA